jgi:hypothetical protein
MKLLQATFEAINAETQLLFASDWPHWDFDPPTAITTIPFLSEQAKRNILGLNAARVFNLEVKRMRPQTRDVLGARQEAAASAERPEVLRQTGQEAAASGERSEVLRETGPGAS